jgi:hypothetical protein
MRTHSRAATYPPGPPTHTLAHVQLLQRGNTPLLDRPEGGVISRREERNGMTTRMTWPQLQRSDEFRGRWVALDNCRYDAKTAQPVEGSVVDADEDLAELCSRIRSEDGRHCAIVFCGQQVEVEPMPSNRQPMVTVSRMLTH